MYSSIFLSIFIYQTVTHAFAAEPPRTARLEPAPFIVPAPIVLGAYEQCGPEQPAKTVHEVSKTDIDPLRQVDYPVQKKGAPPLSLSAQSALIIDAGSGKILFEKNKDEKRQIASITKLMTALVFLETGPDWEKVVEIKDEYRRDGGRVYLFRGDHVTVKDLFYASLVASGNSETIALISSAGFSESEFAAKMNEKAVALGLESTRFEDVVGLSAGNVSTAGDVAVFAAAALEREEIREAALTKNFKLTTKEGKVKSIPSTDSLLSSFPSEGIDISGGKTGYTERAGFCFVGRFSRRGADVLVSVVLGAPTLHERFTQTRKAVKWAYDNWDWGADPLEP
jgi:D-alanyl-D-alanine carboxypeptidase